VPLHRVAAPLVHPSITAAMTRTRRDPRPSSPQPTAHATSAEPAVWWTPAIQRSPRARRGRRGCSSSGAHWTNCERRDHGSATWRLTSDRRASASPWMGVRPASRRSVVGRSGPRRQLDVWIARRRCGLLPRPGHPAVLGDDAPGDTGGRHHAAADADEPEELDVARLVLRVGEEVARVAWSELPPRGAARDVAVVAAGIRPRARGLVLVEPQQVRDRRTRPPAATSGRRGSACAPRTRGGKRCPCLSTSAFVPVRGRWVSPASGHVARGRLWAWRWVRAGTPRRSGRCWRCRGPRSAG